MEILKQQTLGFTEDKLILSQEDFPANHSAQQGSEKAKRMNATCGPKCLEQLERFSQVGLLAKTFMGCLIGQGEWYSTRSKLAWKLRGLKSFRHLYCQLAAKTLPTEGTEFGLLPTPRAMEVVEHPMKQAGRLKDRTGNQLNNLQSAATFGMCTEEGGNREASWIDPNGGWPTQSPVCDGNDGLSAGLDTSAISFSKWRIESLKSGGNAIVPQVAYEIFKAIELTEGLGSKG
jgi:hypothetical protein